MQLTLLNRIKLCSEILSIKSKHSHKANEKDLSIFQQGYLAGMKDAQLEMKQEGEEDLNKKEYTLKDMAKETNRNYSWLSTKAQVIASHCGCRRVGGAIVFPDSAIKFVNETWERRNKSGDETEIKSNNA